MTAYKIIWAIDIDAPSLGGAVAVAESILRDPELTKINLASDFRVVDKVTGKTFEVNDGVPSEYKSLLK